MKGKNSHLFSLHLRIIDLSIENDKFLCHRNLTVKDKGQYIYYRLKKKNSSMKYLKLKKQMNLISKYYIDILLKNLRW
jgi:hypothetical protein